MKVLRRIFTGYSLLVRRGWMTSPDCWSASSFPFIRRGLIRLGITVSVQLRDSFFSSSLKNKRLLRNSLSVFRPFSRHYFLANVRIITLFYHLSPLLLLIHRISGSFFISQIDLSEGLSPALLQPGSLICMVNNGYCANPSNFPPSGISLALGSDDRVCLRTFHKRHFRLPEPARKSPPYR